MVLLTKTIITIKENCFINKTIKKILLLLTYLVNKSKTKQKETFRLLTKTKQNNMKNH